LRFRAPGQRAIGRQQQELAVARPLVRTTSVISRAEIADDLGAYKNRN
jgi:hypothetical protein